ncbi:hypothetical protein EXIGLDRAFT_776890 [Exidia glandulosa HHB12029]|uniref:Uncharacterized protein n=1 Tax=Exidia glandulosa HHB12029 TaxID=1314781 RepID=A0A165DAU7_EXIGL|nr:hypothetical protein EXIGLDRAFT_776890 [Exidia glandulosa HHB12029]
MKCTMDISPLARFTELMSLNYDIDYDAADSDFSGLLPADSLPCLRVVRVVNGWALFKKLADSRSDALV